MVNFVDTRLGLLVERGSEPSTRRSRRDTYRGFLTESTAQKGGRKIQDTIEVGRSIAKGILLWTYLRVVSCTKLSPFFLVQTMWIGPLIAATTSQSGKYLSGTMSQSELQSQQSCESDQLPIPKTGVERPVTAARELSGLLLLVVDRRGTCPSLPFALNEKNDPAR